MAELIMTTLEHQPSGNNARGLDELFAVARDGEPDLRDANFTKVVLNSLATQPERQPYRRMARSGISFDLVGLLFGVVCAYMFVEMPAVLEFILQAVPSSIVISPMVASFALGTIALLSVAAWWVVEVDPKN